MSRQKSMMGQENANPNVGTHTNSSAHQKEEWRTWFDKLSPGEQLSHYFHWCNGIRRRIVDRNLSEAEAYATQHRMLVLLEHKPMMSQKELAQVMEVSTASVAVTLKKMEKSGYIERQMDADDNRFNKISVTEKGREMLQRGFDIMVRIDQAAVEGFNEEELKTFLSLMNRYHSRLNEMKDVNYTKV